MCSWYFTQDGALIDELIYEQIVGIQLEQLHKVKHVLAVANTSEKTLTAASTLHSGLVTDLFANEDLTSFTPTELTKRQVKCCPIITGVYLLIREHSGEGNIGAVDSVFKRISYPLFAFG